MKIRILVTLVLVSITAMALDYQGADSAIRLLIEKSKAKIAKAMADPVEELRVKIRAQREDAGAVPPAEAAKRWLLLLDAYLTIPARQLYSQRAQEDRLSLSTIIASLPPPAAWDEIQLQLKARKTSNPLQDASLRLLAATLCGDESARNQSLTDFRQTLASQKNMEDYQKENLQGQIDQITDTLEQMLGSNAARVATFEKRVALLQKGDEATRNRYGGYIDVPDLVRIADEKKATELLKQVLLLDAESISIEGRATQNLAAKLALQNVGQLKKPRWSLVRTLEDIPLYEAMKAKFPDDNDSEHQEAVQIYLLALIAKDRTADAVKLVRETAARGTPESSQAMIRLSQLGDMEKAGLGAQVFAFLQSLLREDPSLPYWETLIELAAQQHTAPEALRLLSETLAKPDLPEVTRKDILQHHCKALLAADQREEGIRILREVVKAGPRTGAGDTEARVEEMKKRWVQVGIHVTDSMIDRFRQEAFGSKLGGEDDHIRLAAQLASLGRLLGQPEWIEEALKAASATVEKMAPDAPQRDSIVHSLAHLLLNHDRGPEAEKVLLDLLGDQVAPKADRSGHQNIDETLALLAYVYHKAGRHADVVSLLEKSPHWSAPDLAALESLNVKSTPLILIAADSLAAAGRTDDARRIIRRAVQDYPANDRVYELLIRVGTDEPLEPLLDRLAKLDLFQERPLIWKAHLQFKGGNNAEAERTIRAAIAIDPSDGEQGKGDRMRAYAILGDVLEKKGDVETAKIMRGAVSAIRKSEEADDWWTAGLLTEAVRRYEASLKDFADAYCVQARLALRYSEMGEFIKAEQHYMRAFELMPDSFGRVESHCFGCEGAFSGARAQSAADKVFARLASIPPVNPRVHYLIGYLRDSQGRPAEAAEAYRAAVKADPDYLNAWNKLSGLSDSIDLPPEETENAILQVFRLDPAGHHSSADLQNLRDLRRLWTTVLETEQRLPKIETGPLLPLPATRAQIEAKRGTGSDNAWNTWSYPSLFSRRNDIREHLASNPLIEAILQLIENGNRG